MEECKWKAIPGFPGYAVSENGDVASNKCGQIILMSPNSHYSGHKRLDLWRDKKKVNVFIHRLVATTFIRELNGEEVVHHKDNNPANNHVSNLEILLSRGYNTSRSWKDGHAHKEKRYSDETINLVRFLSRRGVKGKFLASILGCCEATISKYIRSEVGPNEL